MNNERIDLTQFEDMPKQMETEWHEHDIYGARYLIRICEPETPWVVGAIVPDFEPYGVFDKDKVEQEKMAKLFAMTPALVAELKRCYEREDIIIRALKDAWIGNTCWHQPSEHLEDIAETRGSTLGHIASLLQVDVNRQDIHDLEYGCGGENCEHNASQ